MKKSFFLFFFSILFSLALLASGFCEETFMFYNGDDQFYMSNLADNEMNPFSLFENLTVTLISPANSTVFNVTLDTNIVFTFNSTNPFNRTLNFSIYINNQLNQSALNVTNFTINFNSAGTYNWYVIANDGVNNATSETRTFTIIEKKETTGGGYRGGYRGPSGSEISASKVFNIIEIDKEAQWDISYSEIPITQVYLVSKKELKNVEIKITKKNPQVLDKISYFYCEFTKKNIDDSDLSRVIIKFSVKKDWLKEKGINENNIVLKRYTTAWDELPTKLISSDEKNFFYESESPGFSYFSIGEKTIKEEITGNVIVQPVVKEEEQKNEEEQAIAEKEQVKVEGRNNLFLWLFLIIIALIIVLFIISKTRKKPKTKEENKEEHKHPKEIEHDRIVMELKKEIEDEEKTRSDLLKELHHKYHKK